MVRRVGRIPSTGLVAMGPIDIGGDILGGEFKDSAVDVLTTARDGIKPLARPPRHEGATQEKGKILVGWKIN